MNATCFICDKHFLTDEDVRTVKERGIGTLIKCSEKRGDGKGAALVGLNSIKVHEKCTKLYTNEKSINATRKRPATSTPVALKNSSGEQLFDYGEKCLFCAKEITPEFLTNESKKPVRKRNRVFKIRNSSTKEGIIKAAHQHDDDWSEEVLKRVEGVELHLVEAQYHQPCFSSFCLPTRTSGASGGRPAEPHVSAAMARIFEYLEENKDQCQFSLRELSSLVDDPPTDATLKTKLKERYKEDIVITSLVGRTPIISFRNHTVLLDSWYKEKKENEADERSRIVRTAAAIIAEDMRSQIYDTDYYPSPESFLDDAEKNVPDTLQLFLKEIILKTKRESRDEYIKKCTAIAHSIIAAARPK